MMVDANGLCFSFKSWIVGVYFRRIRMGASHLLRSYRVSSKVVERPLPALGLRAGLMVLVYHTQVYLSPV